MAGAVLHSAQASPHSGRIEFGQTSRSRPGWAGVATVEYDGEIWGVELDMIDAYLSDTVGFFEQIGRPGWKGPSRWRSEFDELALNAERTDDQLVSLNFRLWWSRGDPLDNERKGQIFVRASDFPDFAASLRELTGLHGTADRLRPA